MHRDDKHAWPNCDSGSNGNYQKTNAVSPIHGFLLRWRDSNPRTFYEKRILRKLGAPLAIAIRSNHRGRLIGTRAFGKGLIPTVERLSDGSSLVITVGRMYTLEGQGSLGTRNRTRQSFDAGSQKSAYVGRELHVDGSLEVERHLRECAECSPAYDDMGLLQRSLRSDELRYQPSADLTKQVRANLRHFRAEILL